MEKYTKQYIYSKEFFANSKELLPIEDLRKILSLVGFNIFKGVGKNGCIYEIDDPNTWEESRVYSVYKMWRKDTKELFGY